MTTVPLAARPHVSLRPLALPTEHGGWGFLFEPIVLGLLVAPSLQGGLIAVAAVSAFLVRQPLKLALQDLRRGRTYPRTRYCWLFAALYALTAFGAIAIAATPSILVPFAVVAPLAIVQIVYDALGRSRDPLAEMSGAVAMSSVAAAIGLAGGLPGAAAFALSGIIVARSIPAIVYVRVLLGRGRAWVAVALHVLAVAAVALFASPFAVAAMAVLLLRATWGLTHPVPRAQTIGWREIAFGALTVGLAALGG